MSKPVSRALDKLIAAQDGVRFAAVVASGAAAGMAVKVLRHSAEFASRVELLVLASPMLPAALVRTLKAPIEVAGKVSVFHPSGEASTSEALRVAFPGATHLPWTSPETETGNPL